MRYQTADAFRQALETRLLHHSRERNVPLALFRKLVAFEHLLARIMTLSPDDWVVKGGAALVLRVGDDARTTRDLDLGTRVSADGAASDLMRVESVDLEDYFSFSIIKLGQNLPIEDASVVRFKVQADLDGRRFEHFTVDVGLDYSSDVRPDVVRFESLLGFAGLPPVDIRAVPLELHLAEKLHAYSRVYSGNRVNTRVRDLVDIILIGSMSTFTADSLANAI